MPFLSPPMHSDSENSVLSPWCLLLSVLFFPMCFLWDLLVLIFFQGVLQAHREGTKPPWELQLCCNSFFRTQHWQGEKKNPLEKHKTCSVLPLLRGVSQWELLSHSICQELGQAARCPLGWGFLMFRVTHSSFGRSRGAGCFYSFNFFQCVKA